MPKGQKQCGKCGAFCGPRKKVCTCGLAFTFKEKKIISKKEAIINEYRPQRNFVYVPKGSCPYPIPKTNLKEWLEKIICYKSAGLLYSREALISFVLHSKHTLEYKKEVIAFIKSSMEEYSDALIEKELNSLHYKRLSALPRSKYNLCSVSPVLAIG